MIGILASGDLWATQVACLNDSKELRYAADLFGEALRDYRRGSSHISFDGEEILFEAIAQGLAEDPAASSEWFVASLSEHGDNLSQWRAYGGGEGGYAIGFNGPALGTSGNGADAILAPVCYDPVLQRIMTTNLAQGTVEAFRKGLERRPGIAPDAWLEAFLPVWRDLIVYVAPVLKHPAFAAEREWRLMRPLRRPDYATMRFRQRGSMLVRHLPLHLSHPHIPDADIMPIKEIVVGPSRHGAISRIGVGDLLLSRSYPVGMVSVELSAIPFQAS